LAQGTYDGRLEAQDKWRRRTNVTTTPMASRALREKLRLPLREWIAFEEFIGTARYEYETQSHVNVRFENMSHKVSYNEH
jgi:hypothetical protein